MPGKLIDDVTKGLREVKDLSPEALKELDQVLNELTKIAKKDYLSPTPNPRDRRKRIVMALDPYLKKLGGTET